MIEPKDLINVPCGIEIYGKTINGLIINKNNCTHILNKEEGRSVTGLRIDPTNELCYYVSIKEWGDLRHTDIYRLTLKLENNYYRKQNHLIWRNELILDRDVTGRHAIKIHAKQNDIIFYTKLGTGKSKIYTDLEGILIAKGYTIDEKKSGLSFNYQFTKNL